jgi:uncharacterized protein YjbI with pentapeptide repeats
MSKKQPLGNFVQVLSTKRKLLIQITILLGVITVFAKLYPFEGIGEWTGIGKDSNKSVTTEQEINPKTKEVTKITKKETENFQSSKTLWDFLGLAGTIAIPFVLLYFERTQQRRSLQQAETEKKIADNNLREQALEAYFDRMSELLIDKQLKVLIGKKLEESDPEYPVLDAALNIARARTLSVLRRLDQDGERKGNVIRFLIDSELLSSLDLNGATLIGADLSRAKLSGANLSRAKLKDATLMGADLRDADLEDATLIGADLKSTNLIGANLSGADLSGADLKNSVYDKKTALPKSFDSTNEGMHLIAPNVNLRGADFRGVNLIGANLIGANLIGAKLRGANLSRTNLTDADLTDADLIGADLTDADLTDADLTDADLDKANLSRAKLRGAKLDEAYLRDANLSDTNLKNTKPLEGVYLSGANLSGADLSGVTLKEFYLVKVNLSGTDLSGADLREANLREAKLEGADLSGANLTNAKNLTVEQIKAARNWEQAKYSPEFRALLG